MPIRKAAFGIEVSAGFSDWESGQQWISGSDSGLVADPSLKEVASLFPLAGSRLEAPPIGQWVGSEGTLHLRWLSIQRVWDVVLVFRPRPYIERALNLVLVMRIEHDEFVRGMMLAPIMRSAKSIRQSVNESSRGAAAWLAATEAFKDSAPALDELRIAGAIYSAMQAAPDAPLLVNDGDDAFWRGLQLFVQAGVPVADDISVVVAFDPEAKLSTERVTTAVQVVSSGAPRFEPAPLRFRGVSDEALLRAAELGVGPDQIVAEVWQRYRSNTTAQFEELYSPPTRVLPEAEVREAELPEWAAHVWGDPLRIEREFAPLLGQAGDPMRQRQCLDRLARAMIAAERSRDAGSIVRQLLELRDRLRRRTSV